MQCVLPFNIKCQRPSSYLANKTQKQDIHCLANIHFQTGLASKYLVGGLYTYWSVSHSTVQEFRHLSTQYKMIYLGSMSVLACKTSLKNKAYRSVKNKTWFLGLLCLDGCTLITSLLNLIQLSFHLLNQVLDNNCKQY